MSVETEVRQADSVTGSATGLVRPGPRRSRRRRPVTPRPPSRSRRLASDGTLVAVTAMISLAVVAAWVVLQVVVLGGLSESRSQLILQAQLRRELAAQTAPIGGAIEPGNPIALLTVPTIGLRQVVVEGTASGDLTQGPGHRRDTVLPGQAGVAVLYGRSATYGASFRAIVRLQEGDGIVVTTAQGEFVYRVDGVRRQDDPFPIALAAGGGRLTLVTIEGSGAMAALAPSRTVYVDATLVGNAATGPAGRPGSVPAAEQALGTDSSVIPLLALSMAGLVLVVLVALGLRLRGMPVRVVWVLGFPLLVALAWISTDQGAQLLPNLL